MPFYFALTIYCRQYDLEGLKIKKKRKAILNAKRVHIIHTTLTMLVQTRPRYVSVQNICVQHYICAFPKSYENWCPVYSSLN